MAENMNFKVKNGLIVTTTASILSDINATSTTTGALVVSGGAGISKDLYVGGNLTVSGSTSTFDGYVGIGTDAPVAPLTIVYNTTTLTTSSLITSDAIVISGENTAPGFNIISVGNSLGNRGVFKATRARGTLDNPLVPQENDNVFSLLGAVYTSSTVYATAGINFEVDGIVTDTNAPQRISFLTNTGTSRTERLRISSLGVTTVFSNINATSTTTGALVVSGGAGIGNDLYVGGTIYGNISGTLSGNASTVSTIRQTTNATYYITFVDSNNSTATAESLYTTSSFTVNPSTSEVTVDGDITVKGDAVFEGDVSFVGTATYIYSTNTVYTDNLINIHVPENGSPTSHEWTTDDGQDIGHIFHYYDTIDKNAALILANDSKYLEWYSDGTESGAIFTGTTYGTFKTGSIKLVHTTSSNSTTTGALTVAGGVGIGENLYVGGTIYGNISGTLSGNAATVSTVEQTSTNTHYLTFVDTNNSSATAENIYTTSSISVNPGAGRVGIGTDNPTFKFHVLNTAGGDGSYTGGILVENSNASSTGEAAIAFKNAGTSGSGSNLWMIGMNQDTNLGFLYGSSFQDPNSKMSLGSDGNLIVGGSDALFTTGSGIEIQRAGTSTLRLDSGGFATELYGYTGGTGLFQLSQGYLDLGTSSTTRIRILGTGEVGIGITTPTSTLHVSGTVQITGITTVTNTTNATSTTTGALQVVGGTGIGQDLYVGGTIYGNLTGIATTASTVNTVLQTSNANYFPVFVDSNNTTTIAESLYTTSSFVINPNTGNVGIGTASSVFKVDTNLGAVGNNTTNFGYNISADAAGNPGYSGYNFVLTNSTANASGFIRLARTSSTAFLGMEIQSQSRDGLRILTGSATPTEVVRITSGGNIGIGIITATSTLHVSGTVQITGITTVTNTTNATSTITGALQVVGGVGIGKDLYIDGTIYGNLTGIATTATTATNLASGTTGSIPYQSSAGTTKFIGIGTAGTILQSNGTTATWVALSGVSAGSATTASNLAFGAQYQIPYQTAPGSTAFEAGFEYNYTSNTFSVDNLDINGTTNSISTITGAVIISGGVGIGKDVWIEGSLNATTKSFVINHPTKPGKKLRYGSLEGPENGVYIRGRLTGSNTILLPNYWHKLVDPDSITVNLTPIGKHQNLYVEEISDNKIIVKNGNLINKEIDCFYTVFAERCDVDKLQIEI